ncbi:MAG TPA: hypothetical protein VLG37_03435 [Candidatus Saccharimonadales bacterium]|nr:hypothetical protein [Candidatus Saccharimonadales bacterium]
MPQNSVYDPESDERPVPHRSPSNDELRDITGINPEEEAGMDRRALQDAEEGGGLYNPGGDESRKSAEPEALKSAEESPDPKGLFNRYKDQKAAVGRRVQSKLGKFAKSKWFVGVGLSLSGVIIFIAFLFFFLGALKIPHFMEHITSYQFARTTRQMSQDATNITEEKIAIDAASPTLRARIKARFNDLPGVQKTKETWARLDKYRPNKIISNYDTDGTFHINYDSSGRVVGVTLTDRTVLVDEPTGLTRFIPSVKFKSDVEFAKDVAPALKTALKADDIGPIIRGQVSKKIRDELGISWVAWKYGEYAGKSPTEAELQQARDMVKAINDEGVQASKTKAVDDATKEAKNQLEEDIKNDAKLKQIVDDGGIDKTAGAIIDKAASTGGLLKGVASFLSPVYSIAMPICIIYDGSSIKQHGSTINHQADAQIKTGSYLASAADEIRHGYNVPAEGDGSLSNRLGDIPQTPSELRASGIQVDTSRYSSVQSTPSGSFSYTAFDAIFGGGVAATFANSLADNVCPIATNVYLAVGAGVVNILACFNPFGGTESCVGEEAAAEGAQTFLGRLGSQIASRLISEEAGSTASAVGGYLQHGLTDLVKTGAKLAGATFLTRGIVLSRMNAAHNGLQSNVDLAVDADSGLNLLGGRICQQQLACRPLTNAESAQSHIADQQFLGEKAASLGAFQRYASLNNPDSLLSRFGMSVMGRFQLSSVASIMRFGSALLEPLKSLASLFMGLNSHLALAASTSANTDYGNVQWGYSAAETKLLKTDPSYRPLENQEILDQSGKEDAISGKYLKCFDGSKQVGDMLAEGLIQRDDTGDVIGGLCSPKNLSEANDEFGPQMVFRWRVAQNYNNSMNQLTSEQDVTQ